MSKSLEFCINRASNPEVSGYADRDWSKASEALLGDMFSVLPPDWKEAMFSLCVDGELIGTVTPESHPIRKAHFIYNPDCDFSYFTSASAFTDGTLYHRYHLEAELISKVLTTQTYDRHVGMPTEEQRMKYTIGNFVVLTEFGDSTIWDIPNDKPWLNERLTILLPIKYELVEDKE